MSEYCHEAMAQELLDKLVEQDMPYDEFLTLYKRHSWCHYENALRPDATGCAGLQLFFAKTRSQCS